MIKVISISISIHELVDFISFHSVCRGQRKQIEVLCQLTEAYREKENIAKQLDEVSRESNDVLHKNEETWEENKGIAKQLAEVLRLNENAVKQKDARLLEALSELEFERKARKSAEAKKTYLKITLNKMRVFSHKELEKNHALKKERCSREH